MSGAYLYKNIQCIFLQIKLGILFLQKRNIELKTKAKQKNREKRQVTNICRFMNIKLRGARCLQSENNPLCFKTSFVRSVTVYIAWQEQVLSSQVTTISERILILIFTLPNVLPVHKNMFDEFSCSNMNET